MYIIKKRIRDNIYEKTQIGIKGQATIELKDPITDKVKERITQHNTISEWIAKAHEGGIRNQAYQGGGISYIDWFKTLVLCSTPLNINYNTKNINIYSLDATGTKLKSFTNHPNIVGYCTNLSTSLDTSSKAGIYDTVASNSGRFINSTRRVFDFPASKANGTIYSVFMAVGLDIFNGDPKAASAELYGINLPSNINDLNFTNCKVIGKLNNNNYIVSGNTNYLYEINPITGYKVNTFTLPSSINSNRLTILNNKLYYFSGENGTNGTIAIQQADIVSTISFGSDTNITIKKVSSAWFSFQCLLSDGTYLYSIHKNNSNNFFIARIDNALTNVVYYDYLTNTLDFQFTYWQLDPIDNTILFNYYLANSYAANHYLKYKVTPSNSNEYLNLYTNAEQLSICSSSNSSWNGINKINNKYYSGDFKTELFPNNFGSMLNLDTPITKDAEHSMTVTYDYTIL